MGDDTRGFLATVRSLGRQGLEVHAAPSDFRAPALASRYIRAVHDVPPWMEGGAAWLACMQSLLREGGFALVIPCDERNLLPLQRHRAELEPLARLAIPDDTGVEVLFDKHATRELAVRMGVAVAPGRLLRAEDRAAAVLAEFGAPVVVKPRRSYTLDGLASRGRVHVLDDAAKLERVLAEADAESTILEGYFEGSGLGVSILASRGRLLQAFQHHRVHERSGSSFYRVSAALDPALVRACAALAEGVGYTGVAMCEFKRSAAGEWVLLEVNARPWGSLPLPVALGVDFPFRWYRLLVDGVETPAVGYRAGVFGRNVMPDLVASVAEAQARGLSPARFGLFMAGRLLEMRRVLTGAEVQDVLVRDDLGPARAEIGRALRGATRRVRQRLPGAARRVRAEAEATVRTAAAAAVADARPVRVLFVCQGNICRSPYAEASLRQAMPSAAVVEVGSAGMMPRPGRSTPALGTAAAGAVGVDLGGHRSAWMTRAVAEAASLIVVFDEVNVAAVADRYPGLATPVIKLGDLSGAGNIADPVDGDRGVFDRAYTEIGRGVEALARLLA
ncbi:MAG: hypothetical protein NVSMB18_12280 [Acetobacteraceae bacterium]